MSQLLKVITGRVVGTLVWTVPLIPAFFISLQSSVSLSHCCLSWHITTTCIVLLPIVSQYPTVNTGTYLPSVQVREIILVWLFIAVSKVKPPLGTFKQSVLSTHSQPYQFSCSQKIIFPIDHHSEAMRPKPRNFNSTFVLLNGPKCCTAAAAFFNVRRVISQQIWCVDFILHSYILFLHSYFFHV